MVSAEVVSVAVVTVPEELLFKPTSVQPAAVVRAETASIPASNFVRCFFIVNHLPFDVWSDIAPIFHSLHLQ